MLVAEVKMPVVAAVMSMEEEACPGVSGPKLRGGREPGGHGGWGASDGRCETHAEARLPGRRSSRRPTVQRGRNLYKSLEYPSFCLAEEKCPLALRWMWSKLHCKRKEKRKEK